jgi:uncharacterized membrane protein (DUF4010 family)
MDDPLTLSALASALGLGLLIGVVRERAAPDPGHTVAGVRTHTLVAIGGAVAASLGAAALACLLLIVGVLSMASYLKSVDHDPGLTGEIALPVTGLLGALALGQPALAAGLSVIVAAALYAKAPLHRLARERISEGELTDALLLAGAALVVLPLLPDRPVDPWGVLVPRDVWKFVVLILAVGMTGHIALRLVGARWGLPLAGFLSGFASSTAAVLGFGHRARTDPGQLAAAAAGALFSNLGSLALLAGVVAAASPALMAATTVTFLAAGLVLALGGFANLAGTPSIQTLPESGRPRAFRLSQALLLGALIAMLLLASAWLHSRFGGTGALVAAAVVAMAEVHAAAASLAQLAQGGDLGLAEARTGIVVVIATSALVKAVLAFTSGGSAYGFRVSSGLGAAALAAAGATLLH